MYVCMYVCMYRSVLMKSRMVELQGLKNVDPMIDGFGIANSEMLNWLSCFKNIPYDNIKKWLGLSISSVKLVSMTRSNKVNMRNN